MPEIEALVKSLEGEAKTIKKDLFKICWFMRGSISAEEAHLLDPESRSIIYQIIDENLEVTKTSGMPFF